MKNKLWLLQLPLVLAFTFAFLVTEMGVQGDLEHRFLRERVFPKLRTISTIFTDWKFKIRGPREARSKVVVVEIDSPTIEEKGRWPWHRDVTAQLIESVFENGAKVVGLDMVFSEPDIRVPEQLAQILESQKLGDVAMQFETDLALAQTIAKHKDRLVLGWTSESACQPGYSAVDECPVADSRAIETHPENFAKFAYATQNFASPLEPQATPVMSIATFIANLPLYNQLAEHSGYFNAFQDPDGYIRRTSLLMLANGKAYPSLPLEMARLGMGETLAIDFKGDHKVSRIRFEKSGRTIPVNELGVAEINFRGPKGVFHYVSASEIMGQEDILKDELNRKLAGVSKKELLKDAYVLIGLTALGVFDMRAFPFESSAPGVDGHASILDNLLSDDFLLRGGRGGGHWWVAALMVFGALAFAYGTQRLESVPALLLFLAVFGGLGVVDTKVFFERNINLDTGFLYMELFTIFVLIIAAKYVVEERNKKFVRSAFTKYVAPAVVDSILKDPAKLTVGGEKRDLTIMFSDIRSFTTFSERMDAKALSSFLNDYLGIMTEIVFANEGTLDKYIGDAIMAFWGAPLDQPKHAENACRASRQMMEALAKNKERFLTQYGVDVNIGIGINTGVVSVGNMGSTNNFSYTVIGDHVNLASRLEGLTKAYGVSILTTRFAFEDIEKAGGKVPAHRVLDHVKVKGKKKAVELIQVLDRDQSAEGLKLFDEARALYTQQKWDEAIAKFREANSRLVAQGEGMDGPSGVFIERCEDFKKTPPAADWDGSWEMHSK